MMKIAKIALNVKNIPKNPNNVSNGTIKISAPPPITPALKPLIIPIIVNPK